MVSLLASVTMDYMLFCKLNRNLTTVVQTIDILARLRPRLVLPKLLACLEDGLSRPEAPLRYTRPLHALALCVASFSHVRFPVFSQVLAAGCSDFDLCGPDDDEMGEPLDELDEFDCVLDDPGTPTSIEGNSPTRLLSQPRSPNRKNVVFYMFVLFVDLNFQPWAILVDARSGVICFLVLWILSA
ncbi:hypothetical protein EG68_11697 [Paragonimus skrjabini miyazakii]|uniref:Uncharacterized protein n=1 Tax=Paragonimus skrjabini miyazakii TaxID=59628 RepID=A0A8S9Y8U4_9TREM|nr:hypothetical protein EG68_11697 [Paragonimus skrjabini miyazakii]